MSYIIITMYISLFLSVFRLLCFSISPSYTRRCSFSSAFLSLSLRLPSVAIMHFSSSDLRTVPRSQSLPIKMAIHPSAGDDRPHSLFLSLTLYFFIVSSCLFLSLSNPLSTSLCRSDSTLYLSLLLSISLSLSFYSSVSLIRPLRLSLPLSPLSHLSLCLCLAIPLFLSMYFCLSVSSSLALAIYRSFSLSLSPSLRLSLSLSSFLFSLTPLSLSPSRYPSLSLAVFLSQSLFY